MFAEQRLKTHLYCYILIQWMQWNELMVARWGRGITGEILVLCGIVTTS